MILFTLQVHHHGHQYSVTVNADTVESAIIKVTNGENCPRTAVVGVKRG